MAGVAAHEEAELFDVGVGPVDDRQDGPLVDHGDAVRQAQDLVEILAEQEDPHAAVRGAGQEGAHRFDGAHVEPTRGRRGHEHLRVRGELARQQHLLHVAAREDPGRGGGTGGSDVVPLDQVHGARADAGTAQERPAAERWPAVGRERQVVLDRQRGRQPGVQAVLGDVGQARLLRPARVGAVKLGAGDLHGAGGVRSHPGDDLGELALAVAGHAAHAHDLARSHGDAHAVERHLAAVPVSPHPVDAQHDVGAGALGPFDGRGAQLHVAADHEAGELPARRARDLVGALGAPGSEDGDAVGDRSDLVELVRDEDHGAALGRHAPQHLEQRLGLLRREDGGGLVEDQQPGLTREGLDDLDALLLTDRQLPDPGGGVDVEPVALAQLGDACFRRGPADAAVLAEHHVLGHGERFDQPEVLVHHADARLDGIPRRVELDRLAVQRQRALVGSVEAGEAVGQRRLPGAVLAEEGVDLPGGHVEVDGLVGDDAAGEPLRDVARGECRGRTPGTRGDGCHVRHEDDRVR